MTFGDATYGLACPVRGRWIVSFVVCFLVPFGTLHAQTAAPIFENLAPIAKAVCKAGPDQDPNNIILPRGAIRTINDRGHISSVLRRSIDVAIDDVSSVVLTISVARGTLRRVRSELLQITQTDAEIDRKGRPVALIDLASDCSVIHGRSLTYGETGKAVSLVHYDRNLVPDGTEEALNPPVPPGTDPGGIAVGHIDSGVNYLLPKIAGRLARSADGKLRGMDFWDEDDRPFDIDTGRSAFFPIRHGTTVASVLLREAPTARLVPYRYPRPDLARMGPLIAHMAKLGVRIVMMPLGSRKVSDWQAFLEAASRHSEILFIVSAGNDGRNIDTDPLYPASLALENMIVVTSSDAFGRLAQGSNWGANSVDIMVPGEKVEVIDHRGATGQASGSSFAVPRVAALAARLAEIHPEWTAAELSAAIRKRAGRSFERGTAKVGWGWIPNPADDG